MLPQRLHASDFLFHAVINQQQSYQLLPASLRELELVAVLLVVFLVI